jgi:hypothetical protein
MQPRVSPRSSTTSPTDDPSLLIEFVAGTRLHREPAVTPRLPIVQNGPPGTFVVFPRGNKVPLPTDQIVFADDSGGFARVGFGGMSFEGLDEGLLVFFRVRDLEPPERLSPERGKKMTLRPDSVAAIEVKGKKVWPKAR